MEALLGLVLHEGRELRGRRTLWLLRRRGRRLTRRSDFAALATLNFRSQRHCVFLRFAEAFLDRIVCRPEVQRYLPVVELSGMFFSGGNHPRMCEIRRARRYLDAGGDDARDHALPCLLTVPVNSLFGHPLLGEGWGWSAK